MRFKDLYDIAEALKQNVKDDLQNIEITINMNDFDLEIIDMELYRMSNGQQGKFHHADTVTATINGVQFRLIKKKEDNQ
jgi:hypothetical protein